MARVCKISAIITNHNKKNQIGTLKLTPKLQKIILNYLPSNNPIESYIKTKFLREPEVLKQITKTKKW